MLFYPKDTFFLIQKPFFLLETISFSNECTKNNGFSLFKRSEGEACPVAKAQYQNLISLADLVTVFSDLASSSISATRGSQRHLLLKCQETEFQRKNTQNKKHNVFHAALNTEQAIIRLQDYQRDHHIIFLSAVPFGMPTSLQASKGHGQKYLK